MTGKEDATITPPSSYKSLFLDKKESFFFFCFEVLNGDQEVFFRDEVDGKKGATITPSSSYPLNKKECEFF